MSYPFRLAEPYASRLASVRNESNRQVEAMCAKLNDHLRHKGVNIILDVEQIKKELSKGSLRERHLARALRMAVYALCENDESAVVSVLETLFDGKK